MGEITHPRESKMTASHSFVFNCSADVYPQNSFGHLPGAAYQVSFEVRAPEVRYMGYVQFFAKKTVDALEAQFTGMKFFESINDDSIIRAYNEAPCAYGRPWTYGIPRPKMPYRFGNPLKALKKKIKEAFRAELRKAALDLLTQALA